MYVIGSKLWRVIACLTATVAAQVALMSRGQHRFQLERILPASKRQLVGWLVNWKLLFALEPYDLKGHPARDWLHYSNHRSDGHSLNKCRLVLAQCIVNKT
jgi:hypothetical protein